MSIETDVAGILAGFEKAWTFDIRDLNKPSADQVLRDLIARCPQAHHARLEEEFFACGPLAAVVSDETVQEIVVNGPDRLWTERAGVFARLEDCFHSGVTFKNFIDRLCADAGIKIDLAQPFADGRWRDFRVHLACAPLTHCDYHLTLRRMPDNPWTLERLEAGGWCGGAAMEILRTLIRERRNVLVIGPTGSGKTSVLCACLKSLSSHERVVIIEDTDELALPNAASTKLLSRPQLGPGLPEVTLTDLVKQSLRMRPFRLAVGEVRGAEAKDLLLALATGHSGSWGTLHASEPRQALLRLEMLIQLGAPQWSVQAIRQLLHLSVDALVLCGLEGGHRCLKGIYKVAALESVGFLLEPLV